MAEQPDLKNIKISQEDIIKATEQWKSEMLKQGYSAQNIQNSIENQMEEVKKILVDKAKKIALDKYFEKSINEFGNKLSKEVNEQVKKPNFWQRIGFVEKPGEDQFKQLYRARQIAGGLETIAGGSVGYGIRQIASAFPTVANFMTGPYYLAIKGVTTALKLLDDEIAKTKKEISSITGGVFSPYQNSYIGAQLYENRLQDALSHFGLRDKALEIGKTVIGSTPIGDIYDRSGQLNQQALLQRTLSQGAAMNYMGSLGISSDSIEKMFRISRTIEGMNETGALATQYRLAQRFKTSRFMTEGEGAQQSLALYEQTKSLGVNFEWASRTVKKFDEALQKGEISLNDFAALTRGVKGSDAGRSTGIAAMLKDYALRNGIMLPEEFMQSSDRGAGLYLQTRSGISNKAIQQALIGLAKEQQGNILFGSSTLDQAAALQTILSGIFNTNISADMAKRIQTGGNWEDLLGGRSGVKPSDEANQAAALLKESKEFYENTRSYFEAGKEGVKNLINQIEQGILIKIDQGAWFDLFSTAATLGVPGAAQYNISRYKNIGQQDFQRSTTIVPD